MHMVNGVGTNSASLELAYPEYTLNIKLLVRGWGKTGQAHSFPILTRLNINLVQKVIGWGNTVVHMVNCLPKNTAYLILSRIHM